MTSQALSDRIVTYSDTVVAFALVNGLAFVITLGEPDIRCSIASVAAFAISANLVVAVVCSYALFWLRDYQRRLLAAKSTALAKAEESDPSQVDSSDETAEPEEALVARFWRIAFWIRLGLIWVFCAVVLVGLYGATQDERCLVVFG